LHEELHSIDIVCLNFRREKFSVQFKTRKIYIIIFFSTKKKRKFKKSQLFVREKEMSRKIICWCKRASEKWKFERIFFVIFFLFLFAKQEKKNLNKIKRDFRGEWLWVRLQERTIKSIKPLSKICDNRKCEVRKIHSRKVRHKSWSENWEFFLKFLNFSFNFAFTGKTTQNRKTAIDVLIIIVCVYLCVN
jgi:hypothetical protein